MTNGRDYLFTVVIIAITWLALIQGAYAGYEPKLDQYIRIAIQNNKDLKTVKYNVAIAKARLTQAGQFPNPSVELGSIDDRGFTNSGEYTRTVGFTQEFPVGGRIGRQQDVARIDVVIAEAEIRDAERKLRADLATAYYDLLMTDRRLMQLNKLLRVNIRLVQVAKHHYHAAEVSELDVNTASLEYQKLSQENKVLVSFRLTQVARLNTLLGRSAESALQLDKSLPSLSFLPNLLLLQKSALENRADFLSAYLNLNRAKADMALARAQRWADWKIGIGIEKNKLVIEGAPPQQPDRALAINLSIPLPLLNQNQGRIQEASGSEMQAYERIQALKLNIESEVASSYGQVQYLQKALKQTESSSLPLGMKNIRLAQEAYNAGQISIFEMVQMQRQQYDLQKAYLNTLEQYLQAVVKLQTAIGGDFHKLISMNGKCKHAQK